MAEPFSPDGPRQLLTDLCRSVAERVPAESSAVADFRRRDETVEKAYQESLHTLTATFRADKAAAEAEFASVRGEMVGRFDAQLAAVRKEFETARAAVVSRFEAESGAAEQELQDSNWEATAIAEAAKGSAGVQLPEMKQQLDARWRDIQAIHQEAIAVLQRWGQWHDFTEPPPNGSLLERHPARRFTHALETSQAQFRTLSDQFAPWFFQGFRPLWIFLFLWGLAIYPSMVVLGSDTWVWAAVSGGVSFAVFTLVGGWLYNRVRRRCSEGYLALRRTLVEAGLDRPSTLETAKSDCERLYAAIDNRYHGELKRASEKYAAAMAVCTHRKNEDLEQVEKKYPPLLEQLAAERQQGLLDVDERYPRLFREINDRFAAETTRLGEEHLRTMAESRERFENQWSEMADRWQTGIQRFCSGVAEIRGNCDRLFLDWNSPDWSRWTPPAEIPQAVRFGITKVDLGKIRGGIPQDERLRPAETEFDLPVLLPFPQHSLLLFKAIDEGRAKAVDAIQSVMLRMLTAMPPGKVRFTIFDPIGLGENFSAFMHLADFEEQLVASRIWTDNDHIEQRLSDLTQHMENVIQVYLRNEFQSIQEYNASAGEMAEPYRVLVIANFPANFSEIAAQRLKSIVASGARCGVFVLMSVDMKLPIPHHFHLSDLEADALVAQWSQKQFIWEHPDYGPLPLTFESPPPPEQFTEMIRAVGREVKDAGRVEVPFSAVAPSDDAWWKADSRTGIDIPLGRAGAMKLQHLDLGRGTSQHVLISGKTGSGKSTLLHVLITNMALRYSPDEVELYLVDFKKGVEFKAYARCALPHARVVAIESEREFGLSVLQRLDAELRTRGDLFRKLGVQDLKGFRGAQPGVKLPRILLMIDEFQELFVEDDRIAQESALLLDRLVRQGRAFGIHVFLGSQTLGGAYSLARSTIGQMAVRIALQCSEADAHLILSEDNTAARLLTRPGEAIYNDANGMFEGNHPFQVVWLSDDERDGYLERLTQFANQRNYRLTPPIVFEGNIPADAGENQMLCEHLAATAWPSACSTPQAWLGSAVAIKDPTAAIFVRQTGSNLLMVGHREEASLSVMATCLVSLAAQLPPDRPGSDSPGARFYVLDGTRPDAPEAGFWARFLPTVPHRASVAGALDAPAVMTELADELARRQQQRLDRLPPIYLFVYNLSRFRDLRKEDEYGFGGTDDKPPSPGKQFATLLREGPAWGIHTIAWCDSYSTLNRILDRQTLRDFEMRVLFQMTATDSSSLMDSPDAARLGVHRAIFYDEGHGHIEKFRPYGLPSDEWLGYVAKQLHGRA